MSHTSTYKHKIKDVRLFVSLANELGYETKIGENISVRHFASGMIPNAVAAIKLPGWKYEIAVKENGEILYDHWGSGTGSFDKLGNLIQAYNQQILIEAIPHSEIEMFTNILQKNGDVKMVLEYA